MQYEGQICRAPMERASFMLPVAVGCSYNACKFCTLFRHLQWRELPLEQIEMELQRVKAAGGSPKKVFFGDGNAFGMETTRLLHILKMLHTCFPEVEQINMDATVTNIAQKNDEELTELHKMGVKCLYLGIESGLADILAFMNKDHTLAQAYEQIERIHKLGYRYAAHIMTGVAGKGRGAENALALAAFLNRTRPESVTNFSLFLHRRAPLWKNIEEKQFLPATEVENLREERILLEKLDVAGLKYDGFHDAIAFRVRGNLPNDRERMLQQLDDAIEHWKDQPLCYAYVD